MPCMPLCPKIHRWKIEAHSDPKPRALHAPVPQDAQVENGGLVTRIDPMAK